MTLLNAPEFDAKKETRKRNLLIGSGVFVAVMVVLTLAGFVLGHGWLFMNLPAEHKVNTFLSAVAAGDYASAYGIKYNDPQWSRHPQKYDYTLKRFTEDWTTESDWKGPIRSFHVDYSKRDDTGTVVAATVNHSYKVNLKYTRSDGTVTDFPYELSRGF